MSRLTESAPTPKQLSVRGDMPVSKGGLVPRDLQELWRLSDAVAKSSMCPRGMKTQDVFVAMNYGMVLGLPWIVAATAVAVINGRPSLWGSYLLGVVQSSGKLEDWSLTVSGEGDARKAVCSVSRVGQATPVVREFSVADAKRARLWGKPGPWTEQPDVMLGWRAVGRAFREAFGDVLCGVYAIEEMAGVEEQPTYAAQHDEAVVNVESSEPPTPLPQPAAQSPAAPAPAGDALFESEIGSHIGPVVSEEEIDRAFRSSEDLRESR